MRYPNFDIEKVIEYLNGTTEYIETALDKLYPGMEEEDLVQNDYIEIDMNIFLCTQCGWWFEICEQADTGDDVDMICRECHPE